MTAHTVTLTTTDPLGASATDTVVINSTASAPLRVVQRSLVKNRILWGSLIDWAPRGPQFSDDDPGATLLQTTLGQCFTVEIGCRFTGCRIYKAPNAVGTAVPVGIWSGVTTGTLLGSASAGNWSVDDGGWQQVTFSTPVDLVPGVQYTVGYFSADGIYPFTAWLWHAQDTCVWPFVVEMYAQSASLGSSKGTAYHYGSSLTFPDQHIATNYYIDPQIEYDDILPGYPGGTDWWGQFVNSPPGGTRHAFPFGIWSADPPFVAEYFTDCGLNFLIGGGPNRADYIAAMESIDWEMDWWPHVTDIPGGITGLLSYMGDIPELADAVVGYEVVDEPDMNAPWNSPDVWRPVINNIRMHDSTRPVWLNLGVWALQNASYAWLPPGAKALFVNESWRDYCAEVDVCSGDHYVMSDAFNVGGNYGVWNYASQVGRLRELCDDRIPIWLVVEATSPTPGQPLPENTRKAVWAALIAGARGITLFGHRFASASVTQDFAAPLHDPAMKAMITALSARLMSLGPALLGPDLGLVTAWTTSNKTAGPMGGEYGVPIHYTTREDDTYEYCFAQAIRPGATTGTLTIPTWAGEVVDVIDESRTVTVSGGGVLTDTFAADYAVHLYRRTP
jgi:hypothetical protein